MGHDRQETWQPLKASDPGICLGARIREAIRAGDTNELEAFAACVDDFPHGVDAWLGIRWMSYAVSTGSVRAVRWMLRRGASANAREDNGDRPVHACLRSEAPSRYAVLRLLIAAGSDPDAFGFAGRTPLHVAAMRNDFEALEVLLDARADRHLQASVAGRRTAEEDARRHGHTASADFIAGYTADPMRLAA